MVRKLVNEIAVGDAQRPLHPPIQSAPPFRVAPMLT
jgi:hypothetical protein